MMQFPYIPEDAPFDDNQRSWLSGFLAGLHSRQTMEVGSSIVPSAEAVSQAKPIHILFGTQTGNAEDLANEAGALAKTRGYDPKVDELDAVQMDHLAEMKDLIIVISTYGEGEMPDNAGIFWEALSAETAPRLEYLRYGVLALGDTSYDQFCQAGKLIDTRLEQLGAKRLGGRLDCDVDFEDVATAWLADTVPSESTQAPVLSALTEKPAQNGWTRKAPYSASVVENKLISGAKSAKEIRHFSFALADSGMTYEAGDALGVMPTNSNSTVLAILERLNVKGDIHVATKDEPLGQLLSSHLEITTPSRDLIAAIEKRANRSELSHIVANGDKEALNAFLWGKDTLDFLNLNPNLEIDVDEFVTWLKPLQHRAYSISSSLKAYPDEVHLTVAAVRWMHESRQHGGVCSTFLSDFADQGTSAPIFMSPNKSFRVPENDSTPMIMVGPGTGIAPFRAFLQERQARGAKGANWLFFGDQHRESDFIYEDEIMSMSASGLLSRLDLAFSRDQPEKIYVQNRMLENGKALFGMLQEGGHFYVCGDATRMARDVDDALHEIVRTQSGMTLEDSSDYLKRLKRDKRYVRDVY